MPNHGRTSSYRIDSNFAGSAIRTDGTTALTPEYPTTARVSIQNLPIEQALTLAGKDELSVRGLLSAKGDLSGTLRDPHANLDVDLTKAVVYEQPFDRIEGRVTYSNTLVDLPSLNLTAGPNRVLVSGSFSHPARDLSAGVYVKLSRQFHQLAKSCLRRRPGLRSNQLNLDAAVRFAAQPKILLSSLKAMPGGPASERPRLRQSSTPAP
jgi:autotransporter translocation and assembly factor TamB